MAEQVDENEMAFRRGYVHALAYASDAVKAGMDAEGLAEWCDRCQSWRSEYAKGNTTEWLPPPAWEVA